MLQRTLVYVVPTIEVECNCFLDRHVMRVLLSRGDKLVRTLLLRRMHFLRADGALIDVSQCI